MGKVNRSGGTAVEQRTWEGVPDRNLGRRANPSRCQFFDQIDDGPESHEEHLRPADELGRTFLAPERA